MTAQQPYRQLDPESILDAVARLGLAPDGHLLALNSYENRVYQVGLETGAFIVAKFYRPKRWTKAQILEEHAFVFELLTHDIPAVAPLRIAGESLFVTDDYLFCLYPRRGGRLPALEHPETAAWLGRTLARLHNVGAARPFAARPTLSPKADLESATRIALQSALLPQSLGARYAHAVEAAIAHVDAIWRSCRPAVLGLHGDCHVGNILWTDHGPCLVDFDDMKNGPAIQDLWMLFTDPAQQEALLDGYRQFREFDFAELALVPMLRLYRQIMHMAWIAARWHDPAFPLAFAWAAEENAWQTHIDDIAGMTHALDEAAQE